MLLVFFQGEFIFFLMAFILYPIVNRSLIFNTLKPKQFFDFLIHSKSYLVEPKLPWKVSDLISGETSKFHIMFSFGKEDSFK